MKFDKRIDSSVVSPAKFQSNRNSLITDITMRYNETSCAYATLKRTPPP